eukprot:3940888-Rhodomonas_salina.2
MALTGRSPGTLETTILVPRHSHLPPEPEPRCSGFQLVPVVLILPLVGPGIPTPPKSGRAPGVTTQADNVCPSPMTVTVT